MAGSQPCKACAPYTLSMLKEGSSSCKVLCPPGRISLSVDRFKHRDNDDPLGVIPCRTCAVGQFMPQDASKECQQCKAGEYMVFTRDGAVKCAGTPCPVGKYLPPASSHAPPLPYGALPRNVTCISCPRGYYYDTRARYPLYRHVSFPTGHYHCRQCPAGRLSTEGAVPTFRSHTDHKRV